jgi:hypothetical protein
MLSAYFDNELSGIQKAVVEKHLQSCPVCRATLDLFQTQREILRQDSSEIPENPDRLKEFWSYAGKSRLGRIHGPRRVAVPMPLAVAAALALALATVLNFLPIGGRKTSDTPMIVETIPQSPTVVSFTISPGELDDFFAVLEGVQVSNADSIHTLPAELPVARFGDPLIVRPNSFEGAP